MFSISVKDLLDALKKYRRLAKQDLLISSQTSDPTFWHIQAEVRRAQYSVLMDCVKDRGIQSAYQYSVSQYIALPLTQSESPDPVILGKEQAIEVFFLTLGVHPMAQTRLRNARRKAPLNSRPDKSWHQRIDDSVNL